MAGTLGGKITLDISEFTKNITRANQLIRENESQWRQSASAIGDWTKSEDGLNSRITTLNKQIEQQRNILTTLNEKKRVLIEEYGAESKQVDAVNKEIAKYGKALDGSYKEQNSVAQSLERLTKSQKSDNVSRETLTKTIDKQTAETKKQKNAQDKLNNSVEKATQGYTILKNVIANLITSGLQKLGQSIRTVVNLVNTLPASTETTRRALIQLETAFDSAGFSAQTAKTAYVELKAVLGNASTDINTTASLIASLSANENDLYEWTNSLVGVYATLGNAFPTQELLKNIQQTANTGKSTENLTKILDNAGYSSAEFYNTLSKMTTQEERLAFIQDTLNELYGEAGKEYQENNRLLIESSRATEKQQLALARFGDALQPIKTEFTNAKTDVLNALADLLSGVSGAENNLSYSLGFLLGSVAKSLTALKDLIAPIWDTAKTSLTTWWDENKETLMTNIKEKLKSVWGTIKTSLTEWWDENGDGIKEKVKEKIKGLFNLDETTLTDMLKTGLFVALLASLLTGGKGTMLLAGAGLIALLLDGMLDEDKDENGKTRFQRIAQKIGEKIQEAIKEWSKDKSFFKEFFGDRWEAEENAEAKVKAVNLAESFTNEVNEQLANGIDFETALKNAVKELNVENLITEPLQQKLTMAFNKELTVNPKIKVKYTITEVSQWTEDDKKKKEKEIKNKYMPVLPTLATYSEQNLNFMDELMGDLADNAFTQFTVSFADSDNQAKLVLTLKELLAKTKTDLENDEGFATACGNIASLIWTTIKLGFETLKNAGEGVWEWFKNLFTSGKKDAKIDLVPEVTIDDIKILGTVASTGGNAVKELIVTSTNEVLETTAQAVQEATETNVVDSFVNGWKDGLEGRQSALQGTTEETLVEVVETVTEETEEPVKRTFGQWIENVWQGIKDGLPDAINTMRDGLTEMFDFVGKFDVSQSADEVTGQMYGALSSALKTMGGWGELAGAILDLYSQVFTMSDEELDQWATDISNMLVDALVRIIQDAPKMVRFAITLVKEMGLAITQALPELLASLPDIIAEIIQALMGALPQMAQVGVELIKGLFVGMFNFVKNGWEIIKSIGTAIVDGFKSMFGIHSPSKVFADSIGKNISLGIAQGIADNVDAINESLDGVNTNVSLSGRMSGRNGGVVVNQYNSYSRQYSRYELYRTRKNTYEAVRGAMA